MYDKLYRSDDASHAFNCQRVFEEQFDGSFIMIKDSVDGKIGERFEKIDQYLESDEKVCIKKKKKMKNKGVPGFMAWQPNEYYFNFNINDL